MAEATLLHFRFNIIITGMQRRVEGYVAADVANDHPPTFRSYKERIAFKVQQYKLGLFDRKHEDSSKRPQIFTSIQSATYHKTFSSLLRLLRMCSNQFKNAAPVYEKNKYIATVMTFLGVTSQ